MRANRNSAVITWNTMHVKNSQNTPSRAAFYSCKRFTAMPNIPNR